MSYPISIKTPARSLLTSITTVKILISKLKLNNLQVKSKTFLMRYKTIAKKNFKMVQVSYPISINMSLKQMSYPISIKIVLMTLKSKQNKHYIHKCLIIKQLMSYPISKIVSLLQTQNQFKVNNSSKTTLTNRLYNLCILINLTFSLIIIGNVLVILIVFLKDVNTIPTLCLLIKKQIRFKNNQRNLIRYNHKP